MFRTFRYSLHRAGNSGRHVRVVSSLAASGLRRAAVFAGIGATVVVSLWLTLAVLGVNAGFAAHPYMRQAFQIAGGLYLQYVAARLLRAVASAPKAGAVAITSYGALFAENFSLFTP